MLLQRTFVTGALLFGSLGLNSALAITGCSNSYLQGTYNAQISNSNFTNLLNSVNNPNNGTTNNNNNNNGTATNANGGNTGAVNTAFPNSLIPGNAISGRYMFDGNGNVIGMMNVNGVGGPVNVNAVVGSYSIDNNCNATIKLNGGRTFYGVLTNQGATVLLLEADSAGRGATGTLQRSSASCSSTTFPESFGFTFFGAAPAAANSNAGNNNGGATTGGTTTTTNPMFQPYASVGSIQLDGAGNFTMTSWVMNNGSLQMVMSTGTYTTGADCGIRLSFASNTNATGGAVGSLAMPTTFNGLISGQGGTNNGATSSGLLTVQAPDGSTLTGLVFAQ